MRVNDRRTSHARDCTKSKSEMISIFGLPDMTKTICCLIRFVQNMDDHGVSSDGNRMVRLAELN
jgi:hypothetical protein